MRNGYKGEKLKAKIKPLFLIIQILIINDVYSDFLL